MTEKLIIPSCIGIPDLMWQITSASLIQIKSICLKLLVLVVTLRILIDFYNDIMDSQISLRKYIKLIFSTIMIILALKYYEEIIIFQDKIVTTIFNIDISKFEISNNPNTELSLFKLPSILLKIFTRTITKLFFLFTHKGALLLMYYLRSILLVISVHFGPIAMILSFLPGPFKNSFKIWVKSYLYVSSWIITLKLLEALSKALLNPNLTNEGASFSHNLLSLIFFFLIFLTPAITSKIFGIVNYPNLGNAVSTGISMSSGPMRMLSSIKKKH